MGKHTDAVKSLDEFRAPWETEGGTDAEIEKPKLRRFIHNLMLDKAKAQDAREESATALETATTDLEAAKAEAADANGEEAQKKIDKLQKKVDDLTTERDKLVSDQEYADLRAEVIGDLDPKYAKYVKGETQDELEKSLKDVREDFNLSDGSGDDDPGDEDEPKVRTRPRANLRNGADPDAGNGGSDEIDFDKVADDILGTSVFR